MFRPDALFASQKTALRGVVACALLAGACLAIPTLGHAREMTPAGTSINNVASLKLTDAGREVALNSNIVSLQVQEILDVEVETLTPFLDVESDSRDQRLAFRIRNRGNGFEAFDLSLSFMADDDFDPTACQIIVDWDGDGVLNMTRDRVSTITPVLAPGASVVAWVSCNIPAERMGALARLRLRAYPAVLRDGVILGTMSSAANGGVFMVLGKTLGGGPGGTPGTGGTSEPATYTVGQTTAQLIKSQSVRDLSGSDVPVIGATVTYTLEARIGKGATAQQVVIADAVPTGTTYIDNSITLDGAPLSDAADGDAGRYANGGIEVVLGDLAPQSSRIVTFQVRIDPTRRTQ